MPPADRAATTAVLTLLRGRMHRGARVAGPPPPPAKVTPPMSNERRLAHYRARGRRNLTGPQRRRLTHRDPEQVWLASGEAHPRYPARKDPR